MLFNFSGSEIFSVTIFVDYMVPFVNGIIGFDLPFKWGGGAIDLEGFPDNGSIVVEGGRSCGCSVVPSILFSTLGDSEGSWNS